MDRRVVITGLGAVTPLGTSVSDIWTNMLSGRSGIGPITLFDASNFPVRIAAEVRDWDMSDIGEDPQRWRLHARQTLFGIASAVKAGRNAGIGDLGGDPLRRGVYLGCGEIFQDFSQFGRLASAALKDDKIDREVLVQEAQRLMPQKGELLYEPGIATSYIAAHFDAQGPNANFTSACVSSSAAIGEAMNVIRRGEADVMLSGGAHSMIHPFGVTGFHRLSTLSTRNDEPDRASRPFDRQRDGFVIGEGGAVLVLEDYEHARNRGADIWCEVTGYGCAHDAFRITDPQPEGRSSTRCMKLALEDAKLNNDSIDYINAHGSGTVVNDRVETLAMKSALGEHAHNVAISSTKSMTGHLTTACGALDLFACVLALRHQAVPPTINQEEPDPDCDLDYVPNVSRDMKCRHLMSNNFGFGGQNVSLVVSRLAG